VITVALHTSPVAARKGAALALIALFACGLVSVPASARSLTPYEQGMIYAWTIKHFSLTKEKDRLKAPISRLRQKVLTESDADWLKSVGCATKDQYLFLMSLASNINKPEDAILPDAVQKDVTDRTKVTPETKKQSDDIAKAASDELNLFEISRCDEFDHKTVIEYDKMSAADRLAYWESYVVQPAVQAKMRDLSNKFAAALALDPTNQEAQDGFARTSFMAGVVGLDLASAGHAESAASGTKGLQEAVSEYVEGSSLYSVGTETSTPLITLAGAALQADGTQALQAALSQQGATAQASNAAVSGIAKQAESALPSGTKIATNSPLPWHDDTIRAAVARVVTAVDAQPPITEGPVTVASAAPAAAAAGGAPGGMPGMGGGMPGAPGGGGMPGAPPGGPGMGAPKGGAPAGAPPGGAPKGGLGSKAGGKAEKGDAD